MTAELILWLFVGALAVLLFIVLGAFDDLKDENATLRDRLDAEKAARTAAQHAANTGARWGR